MSAWQVYWLLQADTISTVFCILSIFTGAAFAVSTVARYVAQSEVNQEDIERRTGRWRSWRATVAIHAWSYWLFFPMFFIAVFMPSTKSIAAMVVLPKITSPAALEAIGTEGRELYGIAKDALKSLTHDSKPSDDKKDK